MLVQELGDPACLAEPKQLLCCLYPVYDRGGQAARLLWILKELLRQETYQPLSWYSKHKNFNLSFFSVIFSENWMPFFFLFFFLYAVRKLFFSSCIIESCFRMLETCSLLGGLMRCDLVFQSKF